MTLMWDPSGRILTQTAAEAVRVDAPPRAKQYKHVAQGSDLMAVFRDQYTPWDFSLHTEGLDVEQHVGALLLRLPLSGKAGKAGAQLDGGRASLEEVEKGPGESACAPVCASARHLTCGPGCAGDQRPPLPPQPLGSSGLVGCSAGG